MSTSLPATRTTSPTPHSGTATPPILPPSRAVPTDFRSSLSAWWSNSSYKDARFSEERLLRRLAMYTPPTPEPEPKSWFSWSSPTPAQTPNHTSPPTDSSPQEINAGTETEALPSASQTTASQSRAGDPVSSPIPLSNSTSHLVATLRNVFIPTPNPDDAPAHPVDPVTTKTTGSPDSSTSSLGSTSGGGGRKNGHPHSHGHQLGGLGKKKYQDYINTLEISSPENKGEREGVVVLHGYAAALGFFFRNWQQISTDSSQTHRRTFFLDWLGMGLSSRPSPTLLSSPATATIPSRVSRAEHFFLSSLESWRIAVGLDKMILVGHSLGGYLASAYAVRYPERVSGLILVSPAGIPRGPEYKKYAPSGEKNDQSGSGDAAEAAVDAAEMELGQNQHEAKGEAKAWQKNRSELGFVRRNGMKFFVWGWDRGLSPFSVLRALGPWGPQFVGRYSLRRFAAQSDEDIRDLHSYIYNTSILKGSGEYCISHILVPGAHARIPILDRMDKIKAPVTFLYGDNDWMDVDGGRASLKILKEAGNTGSSVHVVPGAGHHVYLDNSEETNRLIGEAIRAIPKTV